MKLSKIVKQYREEHNLSQRQFSAMCGMSAGYVSMLEEGVNPRTKEPLVPSLVTMRKLSTAMGIALDELMGMMDSDMLVSLNAKDSALTRQDERTLIQAYRKLNAEGQRTLLATAIAFSNNPYMCLQDSEEEILKDTDEVINKNNKDMA